MLFLLYRISDRQFYDLKDLAILELKDLKIAMFQDHEILSCYLLLIYAELATKRS